MEASLNVTGVVDMSDLLKELGSYSGKYNIAGKRILMWSSPYRVRVRAKVDGSKIGKSTTSLWDTGTTRFGG
ncbi:hypothetical protein Hdeb2414_s0868g00955871 [Helianthus debilis subsp. tardiflorus]